MQTYRDSVNNREAQELNFRSRFFGEIPNAISPYLLIRKGNSSFMECLAEAIELQDVIPTWNPANPHPWRARKLWNAVRGNLSRGFQRQLRFCCSLQTTLQERFGIHGFFILRDNVAHPVTFSLAAIKGYSDTRWLKANGFIFPNELKDDRRIARIGWIAARHLTNSMYESYKMPKRKKLW